LIRRDIKNNILLINTANTSLRFQENTEFVDIWSIYLRSQRFLGGKPSETRKTPGRDSSLILSHKRKMLMLSVTMLVKATLKNFVNLENMCL